MKPDFRMRMSDSTVYLAANDSASANESSLLERIRGLESLLKHNQVEIRSLSGLEQKIDKSLADFAKKQDIRSIFQSYLAIIIAFSSLIFAIVGIFINIILKIIPESQGETKEKAYFYNQYANIKKSTINSSVGVPDRREKPPSSESLPQAIDRKYEKESVNTTTYIVIQENSRKKSNKILQNNSNKIKNMATKKPPIPLRKPIYKGRH